MYRIWRPHAALTFMLMRNVDTIGVWTSGLYTLASHSSASSSISAGFSCIAREHFASVSHWEGSPIRQVKERSNCDTCGAVAGCLPVAVLTAPKKYRWHRPPIAAPAFKYNACSVGVGTGHVQRSDWGGTHKNYYFHTRGVSRGLAYSRRPVYHLGGGQAILRLHPSPSSTSV